MPTNNQRSAHKFAAALLMGFVAGQASAAYNTAFCQSVANTMDIHWRATNGPYAPCTGIEFTNGTLADAADGTVVLTGIGVSNGTCIGNAAYAFTLSSNTLQLVGSDTVEDIPMTLTRVPGEQCFVGTWTSGANVYEAHIWSGAFPYTPPTVPGSGMPALILLAALICASGGWLVRRA